MRQYVALVIALFSIQHAFAANGANISIKVNAPYCPQSLFPLCA